MTDQTLAERVLAAEIKTKPTSLSAYASLWYAGYLESYPKYLEAGGSVPLSPDQMAIVEFFEGRARSLKSFIQSLKSKYNLTLDQYDEMTLNQGGMCAICDREGGLGVDHDHKTGKVRQLLCRSCNTMLGGFKDSAGLATLAAHRATKVADLATKAAGYLKKHKTP